MAVGPVVGQVVRGCTLVGRSFQGVIAALRDPIRGVPTVDVVIRGQTEHVRCFWYLDDPREKVIPAALWQCCWPKVNGRVGDGD